jgi:hypothetical protein
VQITSRRNYSRSKENPDRTNGRTRDMTVETKWHEKAQGTWRRGRSWGTRDDTDLERDLKRKQGNMEHNH